MGMQIKDIDIEDNILVLRHFTFPTIECLNFHTENTSTCVQHSFKVKSSETLFSSNVFFVVYNILATHRTPKQRQRKFFHF